jgi:hypothetical protein
MVENHGFFAQDSARVEKLLNAVNHPNFGWLVDMGNFVCADEEPYKAVGIAAPYAFHVHAKDFHIKSGMLPNPGQGWFRSRGGKGGAVFQAAAQFSQRCENGKPLEETVRVKIVQLAEGNPDFPAVHFEPELGREAGEHILVIIAVDLERNAFAVCASAEIAGDENVEGRVGQSAGDLLAVRVHVQIDGCKRAGRGHGI